MNEQPQTQPTEGADKLAELISDIKVAMMTTVDRQGHLRSRPMATIARPYDGKLWFFTHINTAKVDEIENDERVNLSYAKPEANSYVSVSGTARLVRDEQTKKDLWKPEFLAWAPKGPEDANLGLIHVLVDEAEYWDAPSGAMVNLIKMAKNLTGQPVIAKVTDSAKVQYT